MKLFAVFVSLFVVVACTQQKSVHNILAGNQAGIINGESVKSSDPIAKHVVAITDNQWENCTGTLIAKNLVLTAAHCETRGQMMYVAFGLEVSERNLNSVVRYQVVDYRVIPGRAGLNPEIQERDLKDMMILKFEGELPAGYAPAEFLADDSVLKDGAKVIVAGYGVTDGISQDGDGFLKKTHIQISEDDFSNTEILTDERRRGTCNIDSGGPAFVQVDGKLLYWGVTSRGSENCDGDGVYTKISAYRKWVDDMMKDLGAN